MDQILNYFWAERLSGITMLITGLISMFISVYLILKSRKSFFRGFGHCVLLFSILELGVGIKMYTRTSGDIRRVTQHINHNKADFISKELPRIEKIQRNFIWTFAAGLFILACATYVYFFTAHKLWKGIALAMILNLGLLLFNYYFTSQRGEKYMLFLASATDI